MLLEALVLKLRRAMLASVIHGGRAV
jgi:hypothetical protein